MSRLKGTKNQSINLPRTLMLSPEAKLSLLANLIVERIEADALDGYKLLQLIREEELCTTER
jgi:hypothetical protein